MTATAHHQPLGNEQPSTVTIHLQERSLAADLSLLRSEVAKNVLRGRGGITIDVSGVDQISSPTVAAILWARRSCAARQIPFHVTGDAGRNARVLRTCGLPRHGGSTRW